MSSSRNTGLLQSPSARIHSPGDGEGDGGGGGGGGGGGCGRGFRCQVINCEI